MNSPRFEFEFAAPSVGDPCPCCGGLSVRSTGFVTLDEDAYAVYYAAYANNHPEQELALIVSIGDWGENSDGSNREAFYCRLRPANQTYELMLGDASESPWADAELLGRKLSREQARAHPLKDTLFALTDEIGARDPRVVGYFSRAACGETGIPLERNFGMPDALWCIPEEERKERTKLGRNFAKLDGNRHFVRALLSFDVEHYDDWSVGLWVEVSRDVFDEVYEAWDEPHRYAALAFTGKLANDLAPLDLPAPLGAEITVHATDPNGALRVKDSAPAKLRQMRARPWDRSSFEKYAVARGIL